MKVFGKNPIENLERKLKTASIVFSMILTLGAASFAQSVDDETVLKRAEQNDEQCQSNGGPCHAQVLALPLSSVAIGIVAFQGPASAQIWLAAAPLEVRQGEGADGSETLRISILD